jgi:tight adherence protein B
MPQQLLILGLVFLAVLSIVVGGYLFIYRRRLAAVSSARARLQTHEERFGTRSILRDTRASDLPLLDRILTRREFTEGIARRLQRAGSVMTPGAFLLMQAASGTAGFVFGSMLGGMMSGMLGAVVGAAVPMIWLASKTRARTAALEAQLPDAIDMMVNAMRAGYSFQQAVKFIGDELDAPLGPEFARLYEEQRLGIEMRDALLALQERVGTMDMKMVVTAVLIQRETGGNLSEVLGNIGDIIRQRFAIRGEIATLTSQGKLSARIMSALPVVVFLLLSVTNPEYLVPLRTTKIGHLMLAAATLSTLLGYFVMMKIADVEI